MQSRSTPKPLRPAFLVVLVAAGAIGVGLWYVLLRAPAVQEAVTSAEEQHVDVALLRYPLFQKLVLPRGFPIAAGVRFGRSNPFAPLAPVATSTATVQTPPVRPTPFENAPLFPIAPGAEVSSTTPFSL